MISAETLNHISDLVENMRVDVSGMRDQQLNLDIVNFYRERFLLFVGDSCPAAINAYMQKANSDKNINDITKIHIMRDATRALDGKEF